MVDWVPFVLHAFRELQTMPWYVQTYIGCLVIMPIVMMTLWAIYKVRYES